MNRVIHFEIPAQDPAKVISFYEKIFGWSFQTVAPDAYWEATTGTGDGINGAVMRRRDPAQPVTNAIHVASIDETCKQIERAGGQVVVPKTEVGATGWFAYFKDPDGNIFGLWQVR